MGVLSNISENSRSGKKQLAVLLDPEKTSEEQLAYVAGCIDQGGIRLVLVGGSGYGENIDSFVKHLHRLTDAEIVLFPGSPAQFSADADALLLLSLMNSRNADLLVGQHVESAMRIRKSGIEVIPMGYILVDGGRESSVQRATGAIPLSAPDEIVKTAVAAELLGKGLVYIEAGSGARVPVSEEIIRLVKQNISVPLIIGGGIHTVEEMNAAFRAGADIVVVGNHFEECPEDIIVFGQAHC